jgi:hypothetical protein
MTYAISFSKAKFVPPAICSRPCHDANC